MFLQLTNAEYQSLNRENIVNFRSCDNLWQTDYADAKTRAANVRDDETFGLVTTEIAAPHLASYLEMETHARCANPPSFVLKGASIA